MIPPPPLEDTMLANYAGMSDVDLAIELEAAKKRGDDEAVRDIGRLIMARVPAENEELPFQRGW
jgi:hypothetical protein